MRRSFVLFAVIAFLETASAQGPRPGNQSPNQASPDNPSGQNTTVAPEGQNEQPSATDTEEEKRRREAEDADRKAQTESARAQAYYAGVQTFLAFIGIFATAVLLYYTHLSFKLSKGAAESADRALRLSERADVLIDKVGFTTPAPITADSVMEITLRNYGRTRANNIVIGIWQGMSETDKLEDRKTPVTILGAGATISPRFPPLRNCLSLEGFRAVTQRKATFGYAGTVTYEDVFGKTYTLRCKGTYEPSTHGFLIEENNSD